MNCPQCQGRSEVTHTQRRSESVLRNRRCKVCEYKFDTLESFHVEQKGRQRKQVKMTKSTTSKQVQLRVQQEPLKERDYPDEYWVVDDMEEVRDVLREMGVDDYVG